MHKGDSKAEAVTANRHLGLALASETFGSPLCGQFSKNMARLVLHGLVFNTKWCAEEIVN